MKIVFTSVVAGRRTSLPGGASLLNTNTIFNKIKIVFAKSNCGRWSEAKPAKGRRAAG